MLCYTLILHIYTFKWIHTKYVVSLESTVLTTVVMKGLGIISSLFSKVSVNGFIDSFFFL